MRYWRTFLVVVKPSQGSPLLWLASRSSSLRIDILITLVVLTLSKDHPLPWTFHLSTSLLGIRVKQRTIRQSATFYFIFLACLKLWHPTDPIRKGELMLGWCLTLIAQLLTELNHSLLKKRLICPRSGEITFFRVIWFINRGLSHTIGSCFLECRRSSTGWPLIQSSNQKPDLATRKPKEHTKQTKGLTNESSGRHVWSTLRTESEILQNNHARIRKNGYVGKGIRAMIALSSARRNRNSS